MAGRREGGTPSRSLSSRATKSSKVLSCINIIKFLSKQFFRSFVGETIMRQTVC